MPQPGAVILIMQPQGCKSSRSDAALQSSHESEDHGSPIPLHTGILRSARSCCLLSFRLQQPTVLPTTQPHHLGTVKALTPRLGRDFQVPAQTKACPREAAQPAAAGDNRVMTRVRDISVATAPTSTLSQSLCLPLHSCPARMVLIWQVCWSCC